MAGRENLVAALVLVPLLPRLDLARLGATVVLPCRIRFPTFAATARFMPVLEADVGFAARRAEVRGVEVVVGDVWSDPVF